MPSQRLQPRAVERVWGRRDLPPGFPAAPDPDARLGEIWFEGPAGEAGLLVKHLFTADRLSVQVHPGDAEARALGQQHGKDEAWYVLGAEPGAVIGLGLRKKVTRAELAEAARDGSIEQLIDWRPVAAGDFFYSPGGTIHALGGGLSLIEIQQNLDLTYRFWDYGRPRPLHVDEAVAVATPGPWSPCFEPVTLAPGRQVLAAGGRFVLERWTAGGHVRGDAVVVPTRSGGSIDGCKLEAGSAWSIRRGAALAGRVDALIAYEGAEIRAAARRAA
ncbi:MAG: mannose-6-phosphate isomerase [Sphingomonadales bacterium]|nr:mannose-6-phosphate isomerase [Sphingomonadales bacterium]